MESNWIYSCKGAATVVSGHDPVKVVEGCWGELAEEAIGVVVFGAIRVIRDNSEQQQ